MKSLVRKPVFQIPLALLGIPLFFAFLFLLFEAFDKANAIGEHLWVGNLGHNLVIISFVSSAFSGLAYMLSTQKHLNCKEELHLSWRMWGRIGFVIHGLSIFAIIGLIFYMMVNRMYEYQYVLGHTSDDLPFRYIFSAFWEGQEGSFLLWMFWHIVLGMVLMLTAKRWESPVMTVVAIIQAILATMIIGLYFNPEINIGANPFLLFKDTVVGDAELVKFEQFKQAQLQFKPHLAAELEKLNYLTNLKGKGLNPLLQNYWMIIHPPTLFLGFASTIVPFAFAVAGLWTGEHRKWLQPALIWALFSGAILGTGILMGGAWAYEALSFGGYWAWDPVENASLVPWITLVAGIHTALVAKATEHSIRSTYVFFLLTFALVIYSTFLTRSGILSDSSVHAFTEMGLMRQLVFFIACVVIIPFGIYFYRYKKIPTPRKEEKVLSRELWMFIGSLTLLFSACLITYTTSIPVWNEIADQLAWLLGSESTNPVKDIAPPDDDVSFYNQYQYPIGIAITLLTALTQFLHYKRGKFTLAQTKRLVASLIFYLLLALITSLILFTFYPKLEHFGYKILVITSFFSVYVNLHYILTVISGKIHVASSAVAHIGFGLLMVGAVFSGALKNSISWDEKSKNTDRLGNLNRQSTKSIRLPKGVPMLLQDNYIATFAGRDTLYHEVELVDSSGRRYTKLVDYSESYHLSFEKINPKTKKVIEKFSTYPNVLYREQKKSELGRTRRKMEVANPDTRHHLSHDIFTLAVPDWAFDDWLIDTLRMGDTVYTSRNYIVFHSIEAAMPSNENYTYQEGDIPITVILRIYSLESDRFWEARPLYCIRGDQSFQIEAKIEELKLTFRVMKILPPKKGQSRAKGEIILKFLDASDKDFVVIQAIKFPMIHLVWLGSIMMMVGLLMSIFRRIKKKQNYG